MEVTIQQVNKRFGSKQVLSDIDVSIASGQCVALVGPSGSGKTTLLRLIAGLERVTSGMIRFGERDVTTLSPNQRGVTMMFQRSLLFPHLNVEQNIRLGAKQLTPIELDSWLYRVGLEGRGRSAIHELSGGEQQRASLARALASQPDFLLLDEPFSSLDVPRRRELRTLIRKLTEEQGVTTLLVTHDREEAMAMADVIYVLEQGRIVDRGTPITLSQTSPFFGEGIYIEATWYPLTSVNLVSRPTKETDERVTITKELIQYGVRFYEVERPSGERLVLSSDETIHSIEGYIVRKEG